ncbi:hypothetical protein OJAV_G00066640 [Oryzias javanicus]|uniref:Uncharacterized protein n=1 Tax=Oryzias javanicus TaxID=123683 RepID=A0A437D6L5_ORYJA|nr:hypothetical protein OJAV_G00066640 [Oryzias javanicus]
MFNFTRDRNASVQPGTPLKSWLSGVAAGRGCLSHFCSADGGALTPTPPSVTSASRVRLFPSYVGRIFLPSTACRNTEINNRGGRAPPLLRLRVSAGRHRRMDGRGLYTSKFPSVKPDPPVHEMEVLGPMDKPCCFPSSMSGL